MRNCSCYKLIFTVVLLAFSATASAAWWPLACCETNECWQGVYVGGQVGGGWTRVDGRFANGNFFNTLGDKYLGSGFDFHSGNFAGGAYAGFNYQCDCFVFGLEGGGLDINLDDSRPSPFFPEEDIYTAHLSWLADAKVRVGYAWRCLLGYVTGGWAGGNAKFDFDYVGHDVVAKSKKWVNGWTVGAGAEWKFYGCFTLGAAYDYFQLHHKDTMASCPNCGTGVGLGEPIIRNTFKTHAFTLRLNYLYRL